MVEDIVAQADEIGGEILQVCKGQFTQYNFCRICQIAPCKHKKSLKNVLYHSVVQQHTISYENQPIVLVEY